MKAVFGIVSLVVVLAVTGWIAKRQLSAGGVGVGVAPPTAVTTREQARSLQDRARIDTEKALQQGAQRNEAAER